MNEIFSRTVLRDKVSIVTGAGRGLGKVMALALAEVGSHIVLTARTFDEIESVAGEISELGVKALPLKMDVGEEHDIERMVDKSVQEFGKIDVLVNNAGQNAGFVNYRFEDIPAGEWSEMVHTNITGVFLVSKIVGKHMQEHGKGKIINIASTFGVKAIPTRICYSVTKAAVIQMTRSLAVEWGDRGITVNCLAPGSIDMLPESADEDLRKKSEARTKIIPMGRLGKPKELGPLLIYLASDASNYITGETVFIDGGMAAV